jgi:hypothetical protein
LEAKGPSRGTILVANAETVEAKKQMVTKAKRILVLLVLASVCVVVWEMRGSLFPGSSRSDARLVSDHAYAGELVVSVVERMTGPEKYFEFLIDLDHGEVSRSEKAKIEVHTSPNGRVDDCQRGGSTGVIRLK